MPRVRIHDVSARKLKDGSYSITGTIPAGTPRAALLPYEDGEEVYMTDDVGTQTPHDVLLADVRAQLERLNDYIEKEGLHAD